MRGIGISSKVNSDGLKKLYIFRALLVRFHTKIIHRCYQSY